jgi:hypothetical protein
VQLLVKLSLEDGVILVLRQKWSLVVIARLAEPEAGRHDEEWLLVKDEDVENCVLESKRRSIWARMRQLLMVTIVLELGGAGALGRSGQLHTSLWLVGLHVIFLAKTSNCNTKARQKCWASRDISICLVIVR